MKCLANNDWIFITDLIYKINSIEDLSLMEQTFLSTLNVLVPYDEATFYLSTDFREDATPVSFHMPPSAFTNTYIQNMNTDYTKWVFNLSKSTVFRESDLWTDEERESQPYYQKVYAPLSVHFAAIAGLIHEGTFVGCCSFYKKKECGDFSDKDLMVIDILKDHLALRLHQSLAEKPKAKDSLLTEKFCKEIELTKKEMEVFELILNGISTAEASEMLCISPNTLKNHLQSIYSKAGVKNKLQLYQKSGLVK